MNESDWRRGWRGEYPRGGQRNWREGALRGRWGFAHIRRGHER